MDLGSFILGQITQIAQSSTFQLRFLMLITALCDTQGVVYDTLTFESLSLVINFTYIKKNYQNPIDWSITFLGHRHTQAKAATPNAPPQAQSPSPCVVCRQSQSTLVPMDQHNQMLQSIYQGQQIIVHGLYKLSIHLGMNLHLAGCLAGRPALY